MKLLVATFFLSGVLSAPFNNLVNKPAAPECNSDASHFHSKKSLLYSYEGETITGLVGTSEVRSGLKLRAKCQITPVLPCTYMLQILEAELLESQGKNHDALDFKLSSGSDDLSRELTARDLFFESHEGVITSFRPQLEEPEYIRNMKRGILSAFQLKLVDGDETITEVDVNGECSADYRIKSRHDSGRVKAVYKTKDLTLCKDRSETNLGVPVTNYPTDKPFSLLKSNSQCKFVMSPRQRFGKVSCEETHLFRPFSAGYNSSSGAITTVKQSLQLLGHAMNDENQFTMPVTEKSSLKYKHVKDDKTRTKNYKEVQNILERLGEEERAKPETAQLFTKLIFAVRRLERKALRVVWYQHYECLERGKCSKEQSKRYQKYIVDALSQCGTLECAQFMVSTITDNKVGTQESVAFLTGIALVGQPSEDMVGSILYFCQETPSRTAFLTLGTLMHKYCRQHTCEKLSSYSQIYQADKFLKGKLRQNCQASTSEELEAITLALKAIGNAGRPYTSVESILKCAVQPGPSFINIDALQALRRMPCSDEITQGLFNIFEDLSVDTEIRTETYLALIRCPSEKVIQKIAGVLDTEKNNQVGSFVWSHLTNALESTEPVYGIPLREAISKALQGRKLRPFKLDYLRFSHAYEASYYNRKYEVGGSSQAQVVFHPDSYFPRSAKLNFTVDVLGASVNLLETSARFEGFETLIERMFGPEGIFPDDHLMELLKIKPSEAIPRGKRSAADEEMNEIKTNLETLKDKMQIDRKNPTGALSLKVFGHELQFLSFEDIDWLQGEADTINFIDALINIARGGKVTYTKSFMLLEANHEIPTGLGIPLKMAVNGSGVGSVTLKGKFDIRNMFWGKKTMDVRGFITPSANIDISGKMIVDAIHASSGIHVNTSLYTSTEINGNATYKEGEGIKLSVEPPTKPIYIVKVKSNLATFLNEKREKIAGSPRRLEHKNCANFTRFLGVQLCGHVSLPMAYRDYNAPYYPLTGESSFEMVFQTTNPNLARFALEGRKLTSEDENRYDWIFNVHVPGLTFGRSVVGNSTFQFLDDGKYLSVSCGVQDYELGKFEAKYNNVTNRLHTKFSTPAMAYLKPVTVETEVFNTRSDETIDIGIAINASYNNYTIQDVLSFHKNKNQYGLKSKFTYWPRKHVTTEARFSLEKKSMYIKMDESSSTSRFFIAGKMGASTNRFYAKIGNDIMKYEMKINGEHHISNKKVMVDIITKPSWNVVKFEAYPKWNALENGFFMRLSHVNSSSYVTGYLGSSSLKRESTLKFKGTFKKQPFLLRASHYVLSSGRRVEWIAEGFGNNANASVEYSRKRWSKNNLEVTAAVNDKKITTGVFLKQGGVGGYLEGMNKTMNFDIEHYAEDKRRGLSMTLEMDRQTEKSKQIKAGLELARGDEETALKLDVNGLGYKTDVVWSYYNRNTETGVKLQAIASNGDSQKRIVLQSGYFQYDNEKGFRILANVLDKEFEAKWSALSGDRSGLKFVALYMKKELSLQSRWMSTDILKELRADATYAGKTTSLISTYRPQDKYLCFEIAGLTTDQLGTCLQLINNDAEKTLRVVSEALGRTGELKVGWMQNTESRGAILRMTYNRVQVSDLFIGIVTPPSYTGISVKGTVKGKSVEALLKCANMASQRSLGLDLRVQGKLVTFETVLHREPTLKGVELNMIYQSNQIASLFAVVHKKSAAKVFKIGAKAMSYIADYKVSVGKTRLGKKLSAMAVLTSPSKTHYKYGFSVSHSNLGANGLLNHVITTKLHYAKDKVLTSTYQLVNSEQNCNLLSKIELLPGQFVDNKIAYNKPKQKLSINYEVLPGIGMTYLASFTNNEEAMCIQSNLTVLGYPMDSSVMLNKANGVLTCKLKYCPVRAPIEFTSSLRKNNGIDFASTLSGFNQVWNNKLAMDYSSKQLQVSFDVLPNIPIEIFAKLFENKQFVLNMSTCSAFSVELAGMASTNDDYQLVLAHKFMDTIFEDLNISVGSLRNLEKLTFRWESKSGKELIKNLNTTVQKLMDRSLANLANAGEFARQTARDTMNYVQTDGRDIFLDYAHKSNDIIIFLKKLLRDVELDQVIEKYPVRTAEILKKIQTDVLELVKDAKIYGTPLVDICQYIKQTVKEISSEISPYTKTFKSDLEKWLSRTVNRYSAISICGMTIEEIAAVISSKAQLCYAYVDENIQRLVEAYEQSRPKMESILQEIKTLSIKAKTTIDAFTCSYNMECTKRNIQVELQKVMIKLSLQRFDKLFKQLVEKYEKVKSYTLRTIKEKRLQEKVMKVVQPIIDYLTVVTRTLKMKVIPLRERVENLVKRADIMVYFNKIKEQQKDILTIIETAKMYTTKNIELVKTNLWNKLGQANDTLESIMDELKDLTWKEVYVNGKDGAEINYQKLTEKLTTLRRIIMEKVDICLKRYANEIERVKVVGEAIYTFSEDVVSGRISAAKAQEMIEILLKRLTVYLKEQKLKAMDKINALKLKETAMKTYQSGVELYQRTSEDLKAKVTALYPKVIKELKKLLVKIKRAAVMYVNLAKVKLLELRGRNIVYLKKALEKLQLTKNDLIRKTYDFLENYKDYSARFVEKIKIKIMKLGKSYERMLKEAFTEYNEKLTSTVKQAAMEIMTSLKSYQDMPLIDIYRNLRLKANAALDKVLGFVIGKTLITYEEVMEKVDEIKDYYQKSRNEVEAKWKRIKNFVKELDEKYMEYSSLMKNEQEKASKYYRKHLQPTILVYYEALNDIRRDFMSASYMKYEQLKLWYEHVKYMKFKEFYYSVRDLLAKWDFNLKDCCERRVKAVVEAVRKIQAQLEGFIQDARDEWRNVIQSIREANEEVKQDAIETFGPYENRLKTVLVEHQRRAIKKLAPLNKKYEKMMTIVEEFKTTVEQYLKRRLRDIKDLDQDEITDMIVTSLRRYPFLMQVKESYTFVAEGHLATRVLESLNKCPFLHQVFTHELWSVLKQEILNHELVLGSQELGKSSMKKITDVSVDYYSRSLPKYRELRDSTYEEWEKFKNNMFTKNEKMKKTINGKREEFSKRLDNTHAELRPEGEKMMEVTRDMYKTGSMRLEETIQRIGEMSINDLHSQISQYLDTIVAPVQNACHDISAFVVSELVILDRQNREMQERVHDLRLSITSRAIDISNRIKEMLTKGNEWRLEMWVKSEPEIAKLGKLSINILHSLKEYSCKSMAVGQAVIDKYVPYEYVLKMSPNEIFEQLQTVPGKAEKVFKLVKVNSEHYIRLLIGVLQELKDMVDPEKIQKLKENSEKFFNDTREQIEFFATEIFETTVFLTKFYGTPDTVYSVHPEMALFADYHLQKFMNSSRIYKMKAMELYNKAGDVLERIFAQANHSYHHKLPELVKSIQSEIKDFSKKTVQKVQKMAKVYLKLSKEYVRKQYAEFVVLLRLSSLPIQDYIVSKRSELTLKLNEVKAGLEKLLKTEIKQKLNEVYEKVLVKLGEIKKLVQDQCKAVLVYSRQLDELRKYFNTDIVSNLPIMAKRTIGRIPVVLDMMKRDLKTLVDNGFNQLQDEILPKIKKVYTKNAKALESHLAQLQTTSIELMNSVKKDLEEELPFVQKKMANIIKKTRVALVSGNLELKLPSVEEIREIFVDLFALVTKQYEIVYTKYNRQYLRGLMEDIQTMSKNIREDVFEICESKVAELREFTQLKIKSLSTFVEKTRHELEKIRQEAKDLFEDKKLMFYTKSMMVLDKGKAIVEDVKKRIAGLKQEARLLIEDLQNKAARMNNYLLEAAKGHKEDLKKTMIAFYESNKVTKYIDVEDLVNKTIEIKEDLLNMSFVRDLVKFGENCYIEGERLMDLAKESGEFALYVIKRVVKYSDVWEFVSELTNPFHWIPPSNSVGMIFGKPHVYTFDGQYYQFTGYKKRSCTYVLAHDFRDNNFTIMSQETALIINTKAGFIKIDGSGKVEATVSKDAEGNDVETTHYELPVEMMQMSVRREGSFIKIKHDTGVDIVCDLRHFLCTFNINKFYHGKLAGLLGTNNNEQYDEFLKPDKTLAKSVVEFANAWEVSGDPECKISTAVEPKPSCQKTPSPRCEELFMSSSSPLASYFKTIDPKPFYDACIFDTSDCKTTAPPSKSFCNVTAAYTALLREKGVWARQLQECVSCASKGIWQPWTERGNKNVDVVLLIPETLNHEIHANNLPDFLSELQTDLSEYNPRYAVIGFGGESAVHKRPHIVTGGGRIFGDIKDVQSAISNMRFSAGTPNTFEAIEYLAHLPFQPGASKVVIMVSEQRREAMLTEPLQKAIKELNMQGVIFNVIGPYFQKKQHRDVLGLWKGQAMMRKSKHQSKLATIGLPSNDFMELAESSRGGVFNLKAYSKEHGDWMRLLKRAMKTTIVKQIDEDQTYCRQCVCIPSLVAEPVTICRINRHLRCS